MNALPAVAASAPDASLAALVAEVADDFAARLGRGESPCAEEYAARHPHAATVLRQVLASLQLIREASAPAAGHEPPVGPEAAGTLGDFRLLREVGRGGMGVVYEAEQVSLGRRVALKVLPFAATMDPRQLQRFQNEARAAAALHHTNIVPVYAVGSERGVHYYAMQFIDGRTLEAVIDGLRREASAHALPAAGDSTLQRAALSTERLPRDGEHFRQAARWALQAAEALDHAHQLGVVHRDVKPANLLVDGLGNLWVADFGLAQVHSDERLTMTGDLLGTLRYMSPEQALARRAVIDQRSDVYSLGVTLYELLTLEPAIPGEGRLEVLRRIVFVEPVPPRRLNPAVPAELETIVLKAAEKDPADRYATARELAEDLRRFLGDEPIRARPPTLLQRARKWARRHRSVVRAAVAATALAALVSVAALMVSYLRISQALESETDALGKLEKTLEDERRGHSLRRVALARRHWEAVELEQARQLLAECPPEYRDRDWRDLDRACRAELLTLRIHPHTSNFLAFSPDGRMLASATNNEVLVWDVATGGQKYRIRRDTPLGVTAQMFFSADSRSLYVYRTVHAERATGGKTLLGEVSHWQLGDGPDSEPRLVRVAQSPDSQTHRFLSPDGRTVAFSRGPEVQVWDTRTGEVRNLGSHAKGIHQISFSPDGRYLSSAGYDNELRVWDTENWQLVHTFHEFNERKGLPLAGHVWPLSPDGRRLAFARQAARDVDEHEIALLDRDVGGAARSWKVPRAKVICLRFSHDGRYLASGDAAWRVILWDAASGRERLTLRGHTADVRAVAFSPDGRRLASASQDTTVRVWDLTSLDDGP